MSHSGKIGKAIEATPVKIYLNDPTIFPYQRQYPLRSEAKQGLKSIKGNLKSQGLLRPCSSPCNIPILGVQKNGEWRLVEDLQLINKPEFPIHPAIPYTILSQIPVDSKWFSMFRYERCLFFFPCTFILSFCLHLRTPLIRPHS
jgi:hypothetical protein